LKGAVRGEKNDAITDTVGRTQVVVEEMVAVRKIPR
jgi:hypothetical protein